MKVNFINKKLEADNIVTLYFWPKNIFSYEAGQYVELTLRHSNPDRHGESRPFTLSSAPSEDLLSITTKFMTSDGSSFKRALLGLEQGHELSISKPRGSFVLPQNNHKPLVFIAGGIGITPFRSMLTWLVAKGERRDIKLFYSVSNEKEVIFKSVFAQMVNAPIIVSSRSRKPSDCPRYLTAEFVLDRIDRPGDSLFYISGPKSMVRSLGHELTAGGIADDQIILDLFTGYEDTTMQR